VISLAMAVLTSRIFPPRDKQGTRQSANRRRIPVNGSSSIRTHPEQASLIWGRTV